MPKITCISIQQKNKNRCNLFVDEQFFASLSLELVYKYRLKEGQDIEPDKLNDIISKNERQDALVKATNYIAKAIKTKRQVKDYLLKKGYSEEIAYYCIDKLKEYKYIDDVDYSKRFINSYSSNQGKKLLEYKLIEKGVKKQDIECAFENSEVDYLQNAISVAKKYLKNKELNFETKAKAYRYLISKGFSYDEANSALSQFFN